MEFQIEAKSVLTLEHKTGDKSKLIATDFNLDVSEKLDRNVYLDKENLPTKDGSQAITQCFIHGLIGNVHYSHEEGYRDSAEHLRYIISELERAFIEVGTVTKGNFK